jgi:hypothetical protein
MGCAAKAAVSWDGGEEVDHRERDEGFDGKDVSRKLLVLGRLWGGSERAKGVGSRGWGGIGTGHLVSRRSLPIKRRFDAIH